MRSERHVSKYLTCFFFTFLLFSACLVFQKGCCPRVKGVRVKTGDVNWHRQELPPTRGIGGGAEM